ncbi:MAG TPA: alpha/beta fold hydrolase [Alphaproteobacteria bacterium]
MADSPRRALGAWLEAVGFGPIETPWRAVVTRAGMRLRAYGNGAGNRRPLVIVPAPIKRAYIWDLEPRRSVVRRACAAGFEVYLLEWLEPAGPVLAYGLSDFVETLVADAVAAACRDAGTNTVLLAGHSLGGTLAAIFAARHPGRVRGLALIEAPLHFAEDGGAFAPFVTAGPLAAAASDALFGVVPGSLLDVMSVTAAPMTFVVEPILGAFVSGLDPASFETHLRVRRWTLDEFPLPVSLFADVAVGLYRDDLFMKGALPVAGRMLGPADLTAPVLAVVDPDSRLIPPASVIAFLAASRCRTRCVVRYTGDVGVTLRHLGILIGDRAHQRLWPEIFDWLRST